MTTKPKPKPGRPVGTLRGGASERVQIRLKPERKKQLAEIAKSRNTTMSAVVDNWIGLRVDD